MTLTYLFLTEDFISAAFHSMYMPARVSSVMERKQVPNNTLTSELPRCKLLIPMHVGTIIGSKTTLTIIPDSSLRSPRSLFIVILTLVLSDVFFWENNNDNRWVCGYTLPSMSNIDMYLFFRRATVGKLNKSFFGITPTDDFSYPSHICSNVFSNYKGDMVRLHIPKIGTVELNVHFFYSSQV